MLRLTSRSQEASGTGDVVNLLEAENGVDHSVRVVRFQDALRVDPDLRHEFVRGHRGRRIRGRRSLGYGPSPTNVVPRASTSIRTNLDMRFMTEELNTTSVFCHSLLAGMRCCVISSIAAIFVRERYVGTAGSLTSAVVAAPSVGEPVASSDRQRSLVFDI
jgi:hypothetical protein